MQLVSSDAVFVRSGPGPIIEALTRLSVDASWWPGARARGEYGWVELDLPASRLARVRFRVAIGPVRPGEGFGWELEGGPLAGRAEWWLEPATDGTIVHHLLNATTSSRMPRTLHRRYRWAIRRGMNALKDALTLKDVARSAAYHGGDGLEADDRGPGL